MCAGSSPVRGIDKMKKLSHLSLILKELVDLHSQINKLETAIKQLDLKLDIQKSIEECKKKQVWYKGYYETLPKFKYEFDSRHLL